MLGRPNELSRGLAQSVIQPTGFFEVFLAVVCSNNGAIGGPPIWLLLIKNQYLKYQSALSSLVNTP